MYRAESPWSRQQEGARQRQSQQQWGKARLASLHKHCSSAEQRESKTVKCLKLELPNPSWGSLERSPGPGALGEQHKRQRRGREGSLGTAASRARRSGSQELLAVPLPAPSHPASRTRQTSPCTHRDRQTPHTAPRGSAVPPRLGIWGCIRAGAAGRGHTLSWQWERAPVRPPAHVLPQETHRSHTKPLLCALPQTSLRLWRRRDNQRRQKEGDWGRRYPHGDSGAHLTPARWNGNPTTLNCHPEVPSSPKHQLRKMWSVSQKHKLWLQPRLSPTLHAAVTEPHGTIGHQTDNQNLEKQQFHRQPVTLH